MTESRQPRLFGGRRCASCGHGETLHWHFGTRDDTSCQQGSCFGAYGGCRGFVPETMEAGHFRSVAFVSAADYLSGSWLLPELGAMRARWQRVA